MCTLAVGDVGKGLLEVLVACFDSAGAIEKTQLLPLFVIGKAGAHGRGMSMTYDIGQRQCHVI